MCTSATAGLNGKARTRRCKSNLNSLGITSEFGKTIDWKIKDGRDFDPANYPTDSAGFIVNEAAVKFMGLKNPVGETLEWNGNGKWKIIGVVKNMVTQSPYFPRYTNFLLPAKA